MGKTSLGLGHRRATCAQTARRPVLIFSLEMGHAELTQRILSSEAEVDSQKLRTGRLVEADWTKIGRAIGRLEVPLFLDDNPRVTVMEIRAKARRMKARHGGLALIVIDYLQLMSGGSIVREPPARGQRDQPRPEDPGPRAGGADHRPQPAQPQPRDPRRQAPDARPTSASRARSSRTPTS